jgi:hypothetical protein
MSRLRDFSTRPVPSGRGYAFVGTAALVLGLAAYEGWSSRAALAEVRARVVAERDSVADLREKLGRREPGGEQEASAVSRALAAESAPPSRIVADVVDLLPPGVRLDGLSFGYGRRIDVDLQVVARSPRDYDAFMERLARSPRFDAITPGAERREGEVRVAVGATYRPEGAR